MGVFETDLNRRERVTISDRARVISTGLDKMREAVLAEEDDTVILEWTLITITMNTLYDLVTPVLLEAARVVKERQGLDKEIEKFNG